MESNKRAAAVLENLTFTRFSSLRTTSVTRLLEARATVGRSSRAIHHPSHLATRIADIRQLHVFPVGLLVGFVNK
jgi:hypothetical protein